MQCHEAVNFIQSLRVDDQFVLYLVEKLVPIYGDEAAELQGDTAVSFLDLVDWVRTVSESQSAHVLPSASDQILVNPSSIATMHGFDRDFLMTIHHIAVRLAESIKEIPSRMYLTNVVVTNGTGLPADGGGYSDIFRGQYGAMEVAIKCFRVHINPNGKRDLRKIVSQTCIRCGTASPDICRLSAK